MIATDWIYEVETSENSTNQTEAPPRTLHDLRLDILASRRDRAWVETISPHQPPLCVFIGVRQPRRYIDPCLIKLPVYCLRAGLMAFCSVVVAFVLRLRFNAVLGVVFLLLASCCLQLLA